MKGPFEMRICTIATAACQTGLNRLCASLKLSGCTGRLDVFTPDNEPVPKLPDGCVQHRTRAWWPGRSTAEAKKQSRDPKVVSLSSVCNLAALAKPDVFMHYPDGTEVLYVDGADVLFLENPSRLLNMFWESGLPLGALRYEPEEPALDKPRPGMELLRHMMLGRKFARYNNGVILAHMDYEARMFMELWRTTLGYAIAPATLAGKGSRRTVVGDQVAFNIAARELDKYHRIYWIPPEWNCRGYPQVNRCVIRDGRLYHPDTGERVCLAHCSGSRDFREDIVKLATGDLNESFYRNQS